MTEKEGKYTINGIIDFERAFYGDPYADFVAAKMIYSNIENEPTFIEGYNEQAEKELTFTENQRIRMNLYRLYMSLNLGVETYRYDELYKQKVLKCVNFNIKKLLYILSY